MKQFISIAALSLFINILPGCEKTVDKPDACFTPSKTTVNVNDLISFDNCSTGADSYLWEFGDDSTSTEIAPFHSYASSGQYPVKLTVTNKGGNDVATSVIVVEGSATVDPTVYNIPVTWVDHYVNEFSASGDWTEGSTADYNNYISGGTYTITNLSLTYTLFFGTSALIMPASTENYDIEISCKIEYDNENFGDGIYWAKNPDAFTYYLYVLTVYQEAVRYVFGDADAPWIENWGTGGTVTDYNKMTVRKYGNKYYIFLNETLVHTQNYTSDFGNNLGFIASPDSKMLVDWIHVKKVGADSRKDALISKPNTDAKGIAIKAEQRTKYFDVQ